MDAMEGWVTGNFTRKKYDFAINFYVGYITCLYFDKFAAPNQYVVSAHVSLIG